MHATNTTWSSTDKISLQLTYSLLWPSAETRWQTFMSLLQCACMCWWQLPRHTFTKSIKYMADPVWLTSKFILCINVATHFQSYIINLDTWVQAAGWCSSYSCCLVSKRSSVWIRSGAVLCAAYMFCTGSLRVLWHVLHRPETRGQLVILSCL